MVLAPNIFYKVSNIQKIQKEDTIDTYLIPDIFHYMKRHAKMT